MLQAEGITRVEPLAPGAFEKELQHTLLCFVLVDQSAAHAFCSRYDFGPWPLLPGVESLTPSALQVCGTSQLLAEIVLGRPHKSLLELLVSAVWIAHVPGGAAFHMQPTSRCNAPRAAIECFKQSWIACWAVTAVFEASGQQAMSDLL